MSIKMREHPTGGWEVDIHVRLPDGTKLRERRKAPGGSRAVAHRWAEGRERVLMVEGRPRRPKSKADVAAEAAEALRRPPTLADFAARFLDGYARANRQKPSGIAAKETAFRVHLIPHLGTRRLDEITTEDVQRLKTAMDERAPKTVNNVLTVLSVALRAAVEWQVLETIPCTIRLLKTPRTNASFYDFDEYERLVEAATAEPAALLLVLLGGEAGLRCGEMMALEWDDIDLAKRQLCVARSEWKGHVTMPKGGRLRFVPLTRRLGETLARHRHLRHPRVLCVDGQSLTQKVVQGLVARAARRAKVKPGVHILRHTFCSHLAMRGAPARAIQELAGHQDLSTTQRYMHLSPAALDAAIRLLDGPGAVTGGMTASARGVLAEAAGKEG